MDFKVNCNEYVKVKLTESGEQILRERHNVIFGFIEGKSGDEVPAFRLSTDEDGYYVTQLWILMSVFGHAMGMGHNHPFDLNIIITKGEAI